MNNVLNKQILTAHYKTQVYLIGSNKYTYYTSLINYALMTSIPSQANIDQPVKRRFNNIHFSGGSIYWPNAKLVHTKIIFIATCTKKQVNMTKKCHNHRPQINPRHGTTMKNYITLTATQQQQHN